MNPRIAFPFLLLPEEAVLLDGWLLGDPGLPLKMAGEVLENWDYARDLEVAASVSIDWEAASAGLQIPREELHLKFSLVAGTGAGTLPRRQDRLLERTVDCRTGQLMVSGTVPGRTLSGRLRLSLTVSLDAPEGKGSPLSPKERGSRLWSTSHDILIEDGGDSRFPVEVASFSQVFGGRPQEWAPWYLHWSPGSLLGDFSAGIRLYVNSDHEDWLARVTAGDGPTLQAMMGDVMSQMIESMFRDGFDVRELSGSDEGSIGRQVLQWLEIAFPGQEPESMKALMDRDPGSFRAAIVSVAAMGSPDA